MLLLKHSKAYFFFKKYNLYEYLTTKLYCLKKIYVKVYFGLWILHHSQKKLRTFPCSKSAIKTPENGVNYVQDIRTMSSASISLVDFEQVNVCLDVVKGLLSGCWSILKMLCIKFCLRSSDFYWHNTLMQKSFLNKNTGDTFTYYIIEKFNQ